MLVLRRPAEVLMKVCFSAQFEGMAANHFDYCGTTGSFGDLLKSPAEFISSMVLRERSGYENEFEDSNLGAAILSVRREAFTGLSNVLCL